MRESAVNDGGRSGRKGERETREDRGGKRNPYISMSRIGVAVVLVSNIPVSRVPQGHPPYLEELSKRAS